MATVINALEYDAWAIKSLGKTVQKPIKKIIATTKIDGIQE